MADQNDGAAASDNRKKPRGRPFQPGNNANPHGRPKEYRAFKERCREFMDEKGFEILSEKAAKGDSFALKVLAEYGFGKAPQYIELDGKLKGEILIDLTTVPDQGQGEPEADRIPDEQV